MLNPTQRMHSSHPHFDDRGTLEWTASYELAQGRAKAEGKWIFIEFGREQCSQCRSLVQNVIPRPEIAGLLAENFVALASDCDEPEEPVEALAMTLKDATMLPFVMITDAEGHLLHSSSGTVEGASLQRVLERLVASKTSPA